MLRPLSEVLGISHLDDEIHAELQQIAANLALRGSPSVGRQRGRRRPALGRYRSGDDEVDLDAALQLLAEQRPISSEELPVRRPRRPSRSVALLADVSGSMDGAKARIAAAAVGALVSELVDEELTVIAFWKDLAVLRVRDIGMDPMAIVDELLSLEPRGLTNVHGAIELAALELQRSTREHRCIVLLSDCVHNAGPDPRSAAATAPPTHVLLECSGEHDDWLAERIARAGGGRQRPARVMEDVAPALSWLLSD